MVSGCTNCVAEVRNFWVSGYNRLGFWNNRLGFWRCSGVAMHSDDPPRPCGPPLPRGDFKLVVQDEHSDQAEYLYHRLK